MVVKNEADRYLESCLDWNMKYFDDLFVFDDDSTDGSADICWSRGAVVEPRDPIIPSFLQHEALFREAAWLRMCEVLDLTTDDWVFALDADEFLVDTSREHIESLIHTAERGESPSVSIPIPEVWERSDPERIKVRVDNYWAKMRLPRLVRVDPFNTKFMDKAMGCGPTPNAARYRPLLDVGDLRLLHFGYSTLEDRQAKYDRYMSLADHGHSPGHIASIMSRPKLYPWKGEVPEYEYGRLLSPNTLA